MDRHWLASLSRQRLTHCPNATLSYVLDRAYTDLMELCCAAPVKSASQSPVVAKEASDRLVKAPTPTLAVDVGDKATLQQSAVPMPADAEARDDEDKATPEQTSAPALADEEATSAPSPAATKTLKVAEKLVKNPSKAMFRHAMEAIRATCLQWATFRTLAPSPASLEAVDKAIAMVVNCVCTHAVIDLQLPLVKKFQGDLRLIRERLPAAEAFVARCV